jgi:hypothetical protein
MVDPVDDFYRIALARSVIMWVSRGSSKGASAEADNVSLQ